jgi:hypothetical protein
MMRRSPDDFVAEIAARKRADGGLMNIGAAIDHDGLSQDNPSDIITAADEAADRLISGQSWQDWVAVGRAFQIGRTQAMAAAGTNRPEGRHYAAAISRWLSEHPKLDKLLGGDKHKALRCRLLDLIDHTSEVEAWPSCHPIAGLSSITRSRSGSTGSGQLLFLIRTHSRDHRPWPQPRRRSLT